MLGLRTTIYKVGDIAKAKEWYSAIFRKEPYFDQPFYVGFDIAGYELGLQPDAPAAIGDNVIAYWGVENVEEEFERCIQLGAAVHEAPENVGGEIVVASVKDPWGNVIGLIQSGFQASLSRILSFASARLSRAGVFLFGSRRSSCGSIVWAGSSACPASPSC